MVPPPWAVRRFPFESFAVKERAAKGLPILAVQLVEVIFSRVRGPTVLLGVIPLSLWNALVAERVSLPK